MHLWVPKTSSKSVCSGGIVGYSIHGRMAAPLAEYESHVSMHRPYRLLEQLPPAPFSEQVGGPSR
jgi:hypothetical protein